MRMQDIARRIAANAAAAADDIRNNEEFPDHLYQQIEYDLNTLRECERQRGKDATVAKVTA